jgi:unsaturated rhamnogalacturonyl hydrolase
MKKVQLLVLAVLFLARGYAQSPEASASVPVTGPLANSPGVQVAATVMRLWPDNDDSATARWTYEEGIAWKGLEGVWLNTGDARYFKYLQHQVDRLVDQEGNIRGYKPDEYDPGGMLCGRVLLMLYKVTGKEKYYKASGRLRQEGGPKGLYAGDEGVNAGSMGLYGGPGRHYLALPFFAEYAALFHEDSVFADITKQFVAIEQRARDGKKGSSSRGWGDPAQARGRYGMALVDVLEQYPVGEAGRETLLAILRRYAADGVKVQDPAASSLFVYTLAKGVRLGYLPVSFLETARRGYLGIEKKALSAGADGQTNLEEMGAFLLAAGEMDVLADRKLGKGRTVLLDYYFNNEHHKDVTGANQRFHYIWEEMDNNGYSLWGHLFRRYGMVTDSLTVAPAAAQSAEPVDRLKRAAVYIIVDPDNERESPAPNFIQKKDISAIESWVKAGGVLVLLGNDSANMEFAHFNELAGRFGIHFNFDDYHKVTGSQFEMGAFTMPPRDVIFPATQKIYIKELSTLKLDGPAKPHFTDKGNVIMAVAKVGKGTVFAAGDPWFYNEYTDGRKLPADFENFNAARDLTQWLIKQAKTGRSAIQ